MDNDNIIRIRINFWFAWLIANAIGLAVGWVMGEWVGLRVAGELGWRYGQMAGMVICEGLIWMNRWAVVSRVRAYDVLKPFDAFFWLVTEILVWFAVESSGREASYREDSLFGIVSAPILAYFLGVIGWLILWLIRTQMQKPRPNQPVGRSVIASFLRVGGSVLIFVLFILVIPFSIAIGEAVAETLGFVVGRAVAGALLGGLLGSITGLALLRLLVVPVRDE